MKKRLEIQTIIVLLIVLTIAGAWIGLQVTRDNLGLWSEHAELRFVSNDLFGLGPRSELKTAGASIGHVRKVIPSVNAEGKAEFTIIAGVRNDYASWTFRPVGTVKAGAIQAAIAPTAIQLELSKAPDAVRAVDPAKGSPPTLALEREQSNNDLNEVVAQYRALGNEIDRTIRQFTEPRAGRTKSVMEEFSEAIPSAAAALHEMKDVGANLTSLTERLNTSMGENGKIDETIASLNTSLVRLQKLTDEMSRTVANLNKDLGTSLRKVNSLLDESTATMTTLHDKVDRFGNTFVGRALIAKPTPSPSR